MKKSNSVRAGIATGLAVTGLMAATAGTAAANNQTTLNGVATQGCSVSWNAHSVYTSNADLYPAGLLTNTDGTPVNGGALGGNGGYVSEVSPALVASDPGILEINRFTNGDYNAGQGTINVRIPVASLHGISGAHLAVTLPALPSGGTWTQNPDVGIPSARWGAAYTPFTWSASTATASVPANGGSFVVDLGSIAAGQGEVIQFTAPATTADLAVLTDYRASLTGDYTAGDGCAAPVYPTAKVVTTTRQVPVTTKVAHTSTTNPSVLVQVDAYKPTTAAQARTVASLSATSSPAGAALGYREDRALWGHSSHRIVSISATDIARHGIAGAVRDATGMTLDAHVAVGHTTTDAWVLGNGASAAQPWGARHTVVQQPLTPATAPVAKSTTTWTTVTTTKPVTTTKTVYTCPDGSTVASATTRCAA